MDVQVDRLSSLPNDVIHLILSFIDVKYAIRTSVLSSRYRFIWTSLPYLNISDDDFWIPKYPDQRHEYILAKFSKFVTHVLSGRDTQIEVYSMKLSFRGNINHVTLKNILNYAFSHNVQQMIVTYMVVGWNGQDFPLSLFTSQSLKHLTFSSFGGSSTIQIKPSSTWELPALTTLHLDNISFYDVFSDLLSKCSNLKNLFLSYCHMINQYDICHPRLSNLTLNHRYDNHRCVLNVDAPRLKNLTIKDWSQVHLRSAPKLHSLVFKGHYTTILTISSNALCSLEMADLGLCFYKTKYEKNKLDKTHVVHKVVDILHQVRSVKHLRLNMETIRLLSSCTELISNQPFSFTKLTSIKVYPHDLLSMSNETRPIEMNLPKSSSGATLTIVCEEIIGLRNALSAEIYMERLWEILKSEKAKFETNMSPAGSHETKTHKEGEAQFENETARPVEKKKLDIRGRTEKINIRWRALGRPIVELIESTSYIFNLLAQIEELLVGKLHISKRDELQTCFASLKAEVDTVVKKIIDRTKIEYDEKQSHISDQFHELATTYQPFS